MKTSLSATDEELYNTISSFDPAGGAVLTVLCCLLFFLVFFDLFPVPVLTPLFSSSNCEALTFPRFPFFLLPFLVLRVLGDLDRDRERATIRGNGDRDFDLGCFFLFLLLAKRPLFFLGAVRTGETDLRGRDRDLEGGDLDLDLGGDQSLLFILLRMFTGDLDLLFRRRFRLGPKPMGDLDIRLGDLENRRWGGGDLDGRPRGGGDLETRGRRLAGDLDLERDLDLDLERDREWPFFFAARLRFITFLTSYLGSSRRFFTVLGVWD